MNLLYGMLRFLLGASKPSLIDARVFYVFMQFKRKRVGIVTLLWNTRDEARATEKSHGENIVE